MLEEENKITAQIIRCAIDVHKSLGPGLLESAYQKCLLYELRSSGLRASYEVSLPIIYKELLIDHGYRIDILVQDSIVIEIKTVETFTDVHFAQILTYLRLGNFPLGLLINFHTILLKNGIRRFINT